jgi:DNA end-binding protein Ku
MPATVWKGYLSFGLVSFPIRLFAAAPGGGASSYGYTGLAETEREAIAKVAMHNREHVVLIRPAGGGLILHTLYYEDELHKANKAEAPQTKFSAKELEMAKSLVIVIWRSLRRSLR